MRIVAAVASGGVALLAALGLADAVYSRYYGGHRCSHSPEDGLYADDGAAYLSGGTQLNEDGSLNMHVYCEVETISSTNNRADDITGASVRVYDGNSGDEVRAWLGSRDPLDDSDYDVCTQDNTLPNSTVGWATLTPTASCLNNTEHFAYVFVDLPVVGSGVSEVVGYSVDFP
jgi:hypothetical protein